MSPQPTIQTSDQSSTPQSTSDAMTIWWAGTTAVDSAQLVRRAVLRSGSTFMFGDVTINLHETDRIVVVGAGKAGAGMARGLEEALGEEVVQSKVVGWINVPADCVSDLQKITLHPARPAGVNEPTAEGLVGSQRILELVASLSKRDLCIVLISGGGSALLPLPAVGVSLADKQAVTRFLSRAGASIQELNTVRKRLSRIKGGGLLRVARAGQMISLIISDVIGDPLDMIASGPTVPDCGTTSDAIAVLERFRARTKGPALGDCDDGIPASVWEALEQQARQQTQLPAPLIECRNLIIGRNETAVDAAIQCARTLGYEVHSLGAGRSGVARDVGVELAEFCLAAKNEATEKAICFIAGGEPVVKLAATNRPRRGGRNQEVALAALCRLWNEDLTGVTILSGGTDGEDGPTDAAGAVCDKRVRDHARDKKLDPFDALSISDSYTFFEHAGGLLKTGPTHTNVMDLQVAIVRRDR